MIDMNSMLLFSAVSGEFLLMMKDKLIQDSVRLSDVKKVLLPLISGRKLSTQIVGSSSTSDNPEDEAVGDGEETVLRFHQGADLQVQPSLWKRNLNIHPEILIQK